MKLILSRKGFDSSAGGCPNPIFPDGSMLALPIPDPRSNIRYQDVEHTLHSHKGGFLNDSALNDSALKDKSLKKRALTNNNEIINVGDLVYQLTKGKSRRKDGAHLDPDMHTHAYPRMEGWRPVLGQTGAAQGHLTKQGVTEGDIFLYFGVFRPVECYKDARKKAVWRFVPGTRPVHCLWGWMDVDHVLSIPTGEIDLKSHDWLNYHPHVHGLEDKNNHLYIASKSLSLDPQLPGHGVFHSYRKALQLSDPESHKPTDWRLPAFFYPFADPCNRQTERSPLSYHAKPIRWSPPSVVREGLCSLQAAARGQEFVLDLEQYPEAKTWLTDLIRTE